MGLLMQVSDFKVHFRLKKLKGICMESMECLNEDAKKKKKKKEEASCTFVVVTLKSLLTPNRFIVRILIMYLMVML